MKKLFIFSLLILSHGLPAYSQKQAKKHLKIAASTITGSAGIYLVIDSGIKVYELYSTGCLDDTEKKLAFALAKLSACGGLVSIFSCKSLYNNLGK